MGRRNAKDFPDLGWTLTGLGFLGFNSSLVSAPPPGGSFMNIPFREHSRGGRGGSRRAGASGSAAPAPAPIAAAVQVGAALGWVRARALGAAGSAGRRQPRPRRRGARARPCSWCLRSEIGGRAERKERKGAGGGLNARPRNSR